MPAEYRTAVVVPTLFGSVERMYATALENLEVQFLANREDHLHFAMLSDFTDAAERDAGRMMPGSSRRRCRGRARAE